LKEDKSPIPQVRPRLKHPLAPFYYFIQLNFSTLGESLFRLAPLEINNRNLPLLLLLENLRARSE